MPLTEDDHVIEALSTDGSNQAFDISVLPRRAWCRGTISDPHGSDASPEYLAIGAIAISDEVSGRRIPRKRPRDLASDPVRRGIGGDGDMHQTAPLMVQNKESEQQLEIHCGDDEKIDRGNAIGVVPQERLPGLPRRPPSLRHVLGNGRLRYVDSQL